MKKNNLLFTILLFVMISCSAEKHYNEWVQKDSNYYYYDDRGKKVINELKVIDNKTYYFNKEGKMSYRWQKIGNGDMYFLSDGSMATGWKEIEGNWYYFNHEGIMQRGWVEDNQHWFYCNNDGIMLKDSWTKDGYYVDKDGIMRKGLGNGYTSTIITSLDDDLNVDLDEVDYGSTFYFMCARNSKEDDELVLTELVKPNGTIKTDTFDWTKGYNRFHMTMSNCNISGIWYINIYDKDHKLLAGNSVVVKANPRQNVRNSNNNGESTRFVVPDFDDSQFSGYAFQLNEYIKVYLEEAESERKQFSNYVDNAYYAELNKMYLDSLKGQVRELYNSFQEYTRTIETIDKGQFSSDIRKAKSMLNDLARIFTFLR